MVSAGVDGWHDYTFMHADYFAVNQSVFDNGDPAKLMWVEYEVKP